MAQTGEVKFFNNNKGFGFIKPDNGSTDIFVHISDVQASGLSGLNDAQKVSFDIEPDRRGKGPKAININVMS
ncbi:cold-shock DNA-binding protein family [Bartonella sp. CDC_skunk]|uniref:Putative cold shock protein y4cH n=1 Tax=Bartonella rochalimae ATCC BAA-1498 TaxID=685782 RepID=E6YKN3_9HYPH|nr:MULTISPECIES: cold-shock protein [Bartonella]AQX18731.1 cold-shock DNA-binding protein family [Bartonella sp. A1379B]AQX21735.1 cold-shock DNA-binding protein family [Bartonella sp. CDC_skunk]AQX23244.1 cold shock protein (beta-ribbon, CspA family) [Bartonella sp. 11B]AQX23454.1 cold shock protein (beta-ribbon, CspA family) [Bartonella sp. 114]AQX25701.1 cold-shock DNA-binding protein family [Bartonella sp. Coyote22sub2]